MCIRDRFWKIKWPSLLPTTLYIVVITTINSFQCFSLIQLLTNGGPNYSTTTIMYYLYEKAFKLSEYGYANTMGVFLSLIHILSLIKSAKATPGVQQSDFRLWMV